MCSEGRGRRWGTPTMAPHICIQHRELTDNGSNGNPKGCPGGRGGRLTAAALAREAERGCEKCEIVRGWPADLQKYLTYKNSPTVGC